MLSLAAGTILKVFMIFEQGAPHFLFTLGPANYGAVPTSVSSSS